MTSERFVVNLASRVLDWYVSDIYGIHKVKTIPGLPRDEVRICLTSSKVNEKDKLNDFTCIYGGLIYTKLGIDFSD